MFNAADYVISMQDKVETGRTKVNFLLTGSSSPFNIWSGTPEFLNYESIYRIDEDESNYITFTIDSSSGSSPFNIIFNGSGNTINSSGSTDFSAGFNLVDGVRNQILNSSGNTLVGIGNTHTGTSPGDGSSFIHGTNNNNYFVGINVPSNATTISSKNVLNRYYFDSTILSSDNSSMTSNSSVQVGLGDFNFLSGSFNNIINHYDLSIFGSVFIGGGSGNTIFNNYPVLNYTNSSSIINGTNNTINVDGVNIFSANLFGSNLAAVSNNYSHFQNLYVDGGMYATGNKDYGVAGNQTNFTLDLRFSFHYVYTGDPFFGSDILIEIPIPSNINLFQFLSLSIIDGPNGYGAAYNIYFVDSVGGFSSSASTTPNQISAKNGSLAGTNRMVTHLGTADSVAYFFIWIPIIQKWVMYTSNTNVSATF